jgi:hypothetical protein
MEMAPWEVWVRSTWLAEFVLDHGWTWPVFEIVHYLGLTLLLATVGLFDLRVLGFGKGIAPAALHRLIPFGVAGFVLNLATGAAFFAGFPEQYFYNNAFRIKIAFMALAGLNIALFYTAVFRQLETLPADATAPLKARILAAISLIAWLIVLVAGRLITFYRPPFAH